MNRRNFLKACMGAALVVSLPVIARSHHGLTIGETTITGINPCHLVGDVLTVSGGSIYDGEYIFTGQRSNGVFTIEMIGAEHREMKVITGSKPQYTKLQGRWG